MGTNIRLIFTRGQDTLIERWFKFLDMIHNSDIPVKDYDDDSLETDIIYCSYPLADIKHQISDLALSQYKGTGITIELFFLEREPDEVLEL